MENVWNENAPTLMLDGGDVFGQRNRKDKLQTEFLCEVMGDLGYDAIGLGERDLNYGLGFLRGMIEKFELPFTSANVRVAGSEDLLLPEFLVVERGGVRFGIVSVLDPNKRIITMSSDAESFEVDDPVVTLRTVLPRLREQCDTVVLLGHLGNGVTEEVVREVRGIDLAVMGHTYRAANDERIVDDTILLSSAYEGRQVGRADIFVSRDKGRIMAVDVNITQLNDKVADDESMAARMEKYKADLVAMKEAQRAAFPRNLGSAKENFLGDRACKACHETSWNAYASSAHKQAFRTLRAKGQGFEPECLVCHTTGFQHRNGYSDKSPYNRLTNVQCEACHGYGTEHERSGPWGAQAKDSCVRCHDQENSPNFDYETYWAKIKH
ncbi:MAG: hypothetical protein GY838_11845 [bacterium]|nr:hypothetical protein [bacterium]